MRRPPVPLLPLRPRAVVGAGTEWVGGRCPGPFWVTQPAPFRPDLTIWLELPSGLVVGNAIDDPSARQASFADGLRAAMLHPAVGSPRSPERVRVSDPALAAELTAAFGDTLRVTVAPTPELDDIVQLMAESSPGTDPGYLEDGRVSPAVVAELFAAAAMLWTVAPWRYADDDHVLRIDVPALGVRGACLSVMGAAGEAFGFVLFPSFAAYEKFAPTPIGPGRIDLGTDMLSLTFERGADLSPFRHAQIAQHGWRVPAARAHPILRQTESDGLLRPHTDREVHLMTACARTIGAFFAKHGDLLRQEAFEPVSESYSDAHDLVVRVTAPYQAFELFEPLATAAGSTARAGRNDPCPCGSGRKYKKCHLSLDEAGRVAIPQPDPDPDARLVMAIWRWAIDHHPEVGLAIDVFEDPQASEQLIIPWVVFHTLIGGRPVVEAYLARRGRSLTPREQRWLDAERMAWLGVWEVLEVTPGLITARDQLSGAVHTIHEVSGSRTLVARDNVLGRVVTHDGRSVFAGVHHRPLPPHHAAEVVRRARGRLRRKTAVPIDRLRDEPFTTYLINRWEDEVVAMDEAHLIPPDLRNTDGDPIVVTRDIFAIAPGGEERIVHRLSGLEGVTPEGAEAGVQCFRFEAQANGPTIGIALLRPGELVLESNSTARADMLRRTVEAACGQGLSYTDREATDVHDMLAAAGAEPPPPPGETTPQMQALLLDVKARHYDGWVDHPLPALGGVSPRQALTTRDGRARVDLLLKDMENHEHRLPAAERFDMRQLRRQLGLEG